MAARIQIFTGSALSDRAEQIDAFLLRSLPGARLLVPTHDHARQRMHEMVRRKLVGGILGRPVQTFQDFVEDLLRGTGFERERVDEGAQRLLLERIVADMSRNGELDSLGPAAQTPGFISHLHRTIAQLKQTAVDPQQFARITTTAGRKSETDRVVARAYAAYQDALKDADVYDVQGMYWMADIACRDSLPGALAHLSVLVLDGFDDFTESEFRLVKTIARRIDRVVFGLAVDLDRSPEDQGRLVRKTFSLIERSFEFADLDPAEGREPVSQIEHASLHLFGRTEQFPPETLEQNIRLIECYNPRHEAETIASEIKRAVRERGARLDQIAVVHADAPSVSDHYRSVFRQYGVPCSMRGGSSLDACGLGAFVRTLLRAIESWAREDVVQVITSPFTGADPANAYEAITRAAGITRGRDQWRDRIGRLAAASATSDSSYEGPLDHVPAIGDHYPGLLETVTRLEDADDAFPSPCTASALAGWVLNTVETLGVRTAVDRFEPAARDRARLEWSALTAALNRLKRWYGDSPVARDDAMRLVRQCLIDTQVAYTSERGGVWFGRPEDIRHLVFEFVFCVGMTEGVFPSKPSNNAIYGEHERGELARLGIQLRDADWHAHRQTGSFQRIFDCAKTELTLTWPLTGAAGEQLQSSPFVEDLTALFGGPKPEQNGTPSDAVLPSNARCSSPRALRNRILDADIGGAIGISGLDAARAGARVERRRYSFEPLDEYDGCLAAPANLERLKIRFDSNHRFSASALNTYLQCPFRFFLQRVLRVRTLEEPDDVIDPMLRGLIMHRALETFYTRRLGAPLDAADPTAEADMERAVDDAFNRWAWATGQLPGAVVDLERIRMFRRLVRFLRWSAEDKNNADWAPLYLEVRFGRPIGARGEGVSTEDPFRLETPIGPLLVHGTIDRIDGSGERIRIIDYKSGAVPGRKDFKDGLDVQLALYTIAVSKHLLQNRPVTHALYWSPGRDDRIDALNGQQWNAEEAITVAIESVAMAVSAMREARFPLKARDKRCKGCPDGKVCRFEEGRLNRKPS